MTAHHPTNPARSSAALHPLLAQRWSPRGFDRDHRLDDAELTALLEAARWAPSAGNTQPWRFLVGRRGDRVHGALVELLAAGNRTWAPQASALVLVLAQSRDEEGRARAWASYDTGQAVAAMTLQAQAEGLVVHQMGGFDAEAAREVFSLDPALTPQVVVAIGRHDADAALPERLAQRERAERTRLALDDIVLTVPEGDGERQVA